MPEEGFDSVGEPRPRLAPVRVPWQVEIFDPHLTLLVSETAAEPTEVVFYARVPAARGESRFELHVIKLRFSNARAGRLIPGESDMPFNPLAYDNSALPSGEGFWDDPHGHVQTTNEQWSKDGVCPDPAFYQVLPSPWMQELCFDDDEIKHYLIVGRHAVAEVLAEGWEWQTVEVLGPAPPVLPE